MKAGIPIYPNPRHTHLSKPTRKLLSLIKFSLLAGQSCFDGRHSHFLLLSTHDFSPCVPFHSFRAQPATLLSYSELSVWNQDKLFDAPIHVDSVPSNIVVRHPPPCHLVSQLRWFRSPYWKPQTPIPEKLPKWSARAIKSFAMAELEARKLKYLNTGTEALLMGILVEGTSKAANFLRVNGITLFKVQEETVELLGKSDIYYFSPEHPPLTEPAQKAVDWAVDEKLRTRRLSYHKQINSN